MAKKRSRPPRRARPTAPLAAPSRPAGVEARAKLFWNGRSQAVRLPRAFRFEGDEVSIRRDGDSVVLEPLKKRGWPKGYWERLRVLAKGFEFPEVEPIGGRLLDISVEEP